MQMRALRSETVQKAADDALFMEKELARVMLNSTGDAVLSANLAGIVTFLNRAAERMTGWSLEKAQGLHFAEVFRIIDRRNREPVLNFIETALLQQAAARAAHDYILIHADGTEIAIEDSVAPIHDRGGQLAGAVVVFQDVSESHAMNAKMAYAAQHDYLTDLPNRALLNDRLNQCISLAARHRRRLALLFLDLDHFKHINDSLGHSVGDELLKQVARRLVLCVRRSDTVSRQGGDEFVVLLSEVEHAQDAAVTAEKIRVAIMAPYFIDTHQLYLGASIGISLYPEDGRDVETLIKSADTAMYHAKDSGRNNSQFFENDMNVRVVRRQSMVGALMSALDRHEFVLRYQPIVDLSTAEITGAEALIRWQHPERGLILPTQFISIAEDSGLIESLGQWVLREACLQARTWVDLGLRFHHISVNVSALEFNNKRYLENVRLVLDDVGLEPQYLELELTETALMRDVTATSHVMEALGAQGVRFAMDDFGTGYSSLSHLLLFRMNTLKIDKSFVQDVLTNAHAATIVSAVISLGRSLDLQLIAEGVETAEQLNFLRSRGCNRGQGYYFSKPATAEQFRNLLMSGVNFPTAELNVE
jgi:diguanylate cyclase (GGDEF)-like protein/PAS domain S-box-containing protein